MENIHEWLFDYYALPKLKDHPLFREDFLLTLLESVPADQKVSCIDFLTDLRLRWSTAAFTLGVQTGLRLTASQE